MSSDWQSKPARNLSRAASVPLSHIKSLVKHGFLLFYLCELLMSF